MKIQKREDDMFPFGGHVVNRPTMIKLTISLLCGLVGLVIGFLLFGPTKNIITPTIVRVPKILAGPIPIILAGPA